MSRLAQKQWRMTTLYRIRTKVRGYEGKAVTFRPNRVQRKNYNLVYVDKKRRLIKLKPRQEGETTGWAIDTLDECAYGKMNYQAVTMAHTSEKSSDIFNNIVKFAWDRIAPGLRPKTKYSTRTELDFSATRGSKYVVANDVKGTTPNRLHITEAAYFERDEDIIEAINSLPEDALGAVESTAFGVGNWFEVTFMEAWIALLAGKFHPWHALFDPWFSDPNNRVASIEGRQLRYEPEAREIQKRYGLSDFQIFWWDQKKQDNRGLVYQFYPSCPEETFISSGRPVFDLLNLAVLKAKHERPPIRIDGDVQLWEEPIDGEFYGIGVDTAEGLAHGDNGVIDVVRQSTGEEVAQVAGHISPHELAKQLGIVCRMFRNHSCIIERNNYGHTVIAYAKDDSALNLYQTEETDKITDKITKKIGWETTEKSKSLAIDTLSRDLEDAKCVPHSAETYEELRTFVHGERGKMGGLPGKKDDRVMGLSLANVAARQMGPGDIVIL